MVLSASFPPDVQARLATLDDLETVFEVLWTQEMADYGESDLSLDELRTSWQAQLPSMWVVQAHEGPVVACGEIQTALSGTTMVPLVRVLPAYQGRGIGTALLHLLESQAAECPATAGLYAPQRFLTRVSGHNTAAHRVLEKNGYSIQNS